MSAVEEIQRAIDTLTRLKADSDPVRHDSSWVVDYDVSDLDAPMRILVLDSHNGGYDGSTVAEVTSEGRAQLIVTLHRTSDAQLAILQEVIELYPIWVEADRESDLWATHAAHPLALARAINGGTQ